MSLRLNNNDLRSFSNDRHHKQVWGSAISSVPGFLRQYVNLFSFKHSGVDRLAQKYTERSRIIDFGAGNCSFSIYLASKRNCTVVAVDWSFNALKNARLKYSHLRIIPVCADLHHLPFKKESFTAFITIDTFGHLYNPEKALDSLYHVLQPGANGFFHSECADYRKRWPDSMLISRNGRDIPAESDGHISLLPGDAITKILKSRFTVISSFSPAGYLGWLTGYPEKYAAAFARAGNKPLYRLTNWMSHVKKNIPGKLLLRMINYLTNRTELFFNFQGGGSFFADVVKPVDEKKKGTASIDIIIPTYRRERQLNTLIGNLLPQCKVNDTIIIVSQDDTLELKHTSRHIHVLYNFPPNLPDARNRGVFSGTNEIILFLDDDTIPCEDLLEKHRSAYLDSNINCIAGSIDDPRFLPSTPQPSLFDSTTGKLVQNFAFPYAVHSISFMGAHFSLRRSVLLKTGPFDSSFTGNAYWEDIDFSFRVQKKGYQIHYNPEIRVTHLSSPDGGCRSATPAAFCYTYFTNSAYFALKYAPAKFILSWLKYWKYRLEFETRSHSTIQFLKHDPYLLCASFLGITAAMVRFLHKGKRIGLPATVIQQNDLEGC
jgi:GT2 family glycosyltransferase/SAM-dependent methyltransferase